MFLSSALNSSQFYTIAECDMLASAVDRFKFSMTTLHGALTTQEQSQVIPRSNYVVRRYPNQSPPFNRDAQTNRKQLFSWASNFGWLDRTVLTPEPYKK